MTEAIIALLIFAFTVSMTPGPNNIMLMTSGVNFGFRRSVPHILGVILGFTLMVAIIGFGLGTTVIAVPSVRDGVSVAGIIYLAWLSWRIASADTGRNAKSDTHSPSPMGFWAAAAFQWVNGKAWATAIGLLAVYTPRGAGVAAGLIIVLAVVTLMSVLSTIAWTSFGTLLANWLNTPMRMKWFNRAMAALLFASLIPAIVDLVRRYAL